MAETINISAMAELLSRDLFGEFHWQQSGPMNINWKCEDDTHQRKTHPADVVFYYDEPYLPMRSYILCDLKSYARGSINAQSVKAAIQGLASSIACVEKSIDWRDLYLHPEVTPSICGVLFIYNHDGEYDGDFASLYQSLQCDSLRMPAGTKLAVIGPELIHWLHNVSCDILYSRGRGDLPPKPSCGYFYPDLVQRKLMSSKRKRAATIEMLTSSLIVLEYQSELQFGSVVYYRGLGEKVEEYLYLIDWILRSQLLRDGHVVRVKSLMPSEFASAAFKKATQTYADGYAGNRPEEFRKRLDDIRFESIAKVNPVFSKVEIGMRYD